MRRLRPRSVVFVLALLMALSVPAWATAQVDAPVQASDVEVSTPFVGVTVKPGETASFDLDILGPVDERVSVKVEGLPEGWAADLRGGGFTIEEILIPPAGMVETELKIDVPVAAAEGIYQAVVMADGNRTTDRLDLAVRVAADAGGGVALTAEFPELRGPADVTFTYNLELANETSEEIQFGLQTQGPPGWIIEARPAGQTRASTVTVAGGETERLTVEVDPPDFATAGTYPVAVRAAGSGQTAGAELAVEITGNFDMALFTADERLNATVEAGQPTELPLVVANRGTAPLTDLSFGATAPSGWEVTFAPDSVDRLEPGSTAEVVATITPSEEAIAGDYSMTLRANTAEVNQQVDIRTTVETSTLWGLFGVGIILVALVALVLVFRRFGRR